MTNSDGLGKLALLVGGGPAPGINGVISAVTIEAYLFPDLVPGYVRPRTYVCHRTAKQVCRADHSGFHPFVHLKLEIT